MATKATIANKSTEGPPMSGKVSQTQKSAQRKANISDFSSTASSVPKKKK